jgi:ATP synthase assembly factor FMC1, mitochondrial
MRPCLRATVWGPHIAKSYSESEVAVHEGMSPFSSKCWNRPESFGVRNKDRSQPTGRPDSGSVPRFRSLFFSTQKIPPSNTMSTSSIRSLYRCALRELPKRPLSAPSPLHKRLRATFSAPPSSPEQLARQVEETEQFLQYVKSQRIYATLLERYNPGITMNEEERVRLTARRVGMDMPVEWDPAKKS